MSFAGHVMDMINRQEANRKLIKSIRERRKIMEKPASDQYDGDGFDKDSIRSFSVEERKLIRAELNKEISRGRTRSWTMALVIFLVFIIAVLMAYNQVMA